MLRSTASKPFSIVNGITLVTLILIGAVSMLWAAFFNGYPMYFANTAEYIDPARHYLHHAPVYSFFMYASYFLTHSFWGEAALQALLTSILMMRVALVMLPERMSSYWIAFSVMIATVALTEVSKYVSWLVPDIFASWLFFSFILFIFSSKRCDRWLAAVLIFLVLPVRPGYVIISFALLPLLWLVSFKKGLRLLMLFAFSLLFAGLLNLRLSSALQPVPSGAPNYFINQLLTHGTLVPVLERHCAEKRWRFCRYLGEFKAPHDRHWFLWNEESPLKELGNWADVQEQKEIIRYALKDRWQEIVKWGFEDSYYQLFYISDPTEFKHVKLVKDRILRIIQKYYSTEYEPLIKSRQWRELSIKVSLLAQDGQAVYYGSLVFSIVMILICLIFRRNRAGFLILACLVFLALTAVVFGFLSGVFARYQGQAAWILTYCVILAVPILLIPKQKSP